MCRVIVELSLQKGICVNAVPPLNALWVPVCLPCFLRSLPCVSAFVQKTGLHMTLCALPESFHCCKPCVNLFSIASPNSEGWVVHKERSLVKPTFLVVLALSTGFGLSLVKSSLWISSQWWECVHGDVIWWDRKLEAEKSCSSVLHSLSLRTNSLYETSIKPSGQCP